MQPRLMFNTVYISEWPWTPDSPDSPCPSSAEIPGVYHHIWLSKNFWVYLCSLFFLAQKKIICKSSTDHQVSGLCRGRLSVSEWAVGITMGPSQSPEHLLEPEAWGEPERSCFEPWSSVAWACSLLAMWPQISYPGLLWARKASWQGLRSGLWQIRHLEHHFLRHLPQLSGLVPAALALLVFVSGPSWPSWQSTESSGALGQPSWKIQTFMIRISWCHFVPLREDWVWAMVLGFGYVCIIICGFQSDLFFSLETCPHATLTDQTCSWGYLFTGPPASVSHVLELQASTCTTVTKISWMKSLYSKRSSKEGKVVLPRIRNVYLATNPTSATC